MTRKANMTNKIVLATGNVGKVREMNQMLAALQREVIAQAAFEVPEAEENGLSFVENAIIKARNAATHSGLPAIADDSGLEVDYLKGAPGIYSSRYAGPEANDKENLLKLLAALRDVPDALRTARFQCLLVYIRHPHDPTPVICQGTWEGMITHQPRGNNGFGYDPVFYLPTHHCTSAELPPEIKNQISHRGQALQKLLKVMSL